MKILYGELSTSCHQARVLIYTRVCTARLACASSARRGDSRLRQASREGWAVADGLGCLAALRGCHPVACLRMSSLSHTHTNCSLLKNTFPRQILNSNNRTVALEAIRLVIISSSLILFWRRRNCGSRRVRADPGGIWALGAGTESGPRQSGPSLRYHLAIVEALAFKMCVMIQKRERNVSIFSYFSKSPYLMYFIQVKAVWSKVR